MPSKRRSRSKLTPSVVGRAGVVIKHLQEFNTLSRPEIRRAVVDYFLDHRNHYAKKWGVKGIKQMEDFLFSRQRRIPNFSKMFEGKSPEEIHSNYSNWINHYHHLSRRMAAINAEPAVKERSIQHLKALHRRPDFMHARDKKRERTIFRIMGRSELEEKEDGRSLCCDGYPLAKGQAGP